MCSSNHGCKSHNDGDLSTLKIYDEEGGRKVGGDNSPKVDSPDDSLQGNYTLLSLQRISKNSSLSNSHRGEQSEQFLKKHHTKTAHKSHDFCTST